MGGDEGVGIVDVHDPTEPKVWNVIRMNAGGLAADSRTLYVADLG